MTEEAQDTKENRVIKTKISIRKQEIKDISMTGPAALIMLGIVVGFLGFVLLGLLGLVIGAVLFCVGLWWSTLRSNEEKRLKNEIIELEAELD